MEIGVFSSCIEGESIEEKFSELARIGYDFLELSTKEELIDALPGSADAVRAGSRASGLPVRSANLGTFPPFAEACSSAETRRQAFGRLDLVCDLLAEWGPGGVLLLPVWEPEGGMEVQDAYITNVYEAADRAAARAVRLALEHIGSSKFCPKASEMLKLVRKIGHKNLGIYLDIGNAQSAGEDPVRVLESVGEDLFQLHLKGTREVPFEGMPLNDIA
ncbi:unnamed protein product, partial [marine sediment metagenome]